MTKARRAALREAYRREIAHLMRDVRLPECKKPRPTRKGRPGRSENG